MNVGESQSFAYTGDIQTFEVPITGLYKLEVWGGGNRNARQTNPGGGYSCGFKKLKKGQTLYVCCGGGDMNTGTKPYRSGTCFNGGGASLCNWSNSPTYAIPGGGATHIAFVSGTLAEIGKEVFDEQGLIVAGGGAGVYYWSSWELFDSISYAGGGLTDGSGQTTQTAGYAFGVGYSEAGDHGGYGGGGGYYGGKVGCGGSGWIGGVPEIKYKGKIYAPDSTIGGNIGKGKATITLIAKGFPTIHMYGKDIVGGFAYGKEISDIKAFGKDLA